MLFSAVLQMRKLRPREVGNSYELAKPGSGGESVPGHLLSLQYVKGSVIEGL